MQAKGAAKDVGKGLNPGSSNLPNPSAAADKAAGNAKGLASDAKQGAKNVASDLSENPLSGVGDKVRAGDAMTQCTKATGLHACAADDIVTSCCDKRLGKESKKRCAKQEVQYAL